MKYLMDRVLFNGTESHLLKKDSTTEATKLKDGFETINKILYNWSYVAGYMRQNPQTIRKKFLIRVSFILLPIIALVIYSIVTLHGGEDAFVIIFPIIFVTVGLYITFTNKSIMQKIYGLFFAIMGTIPAIAVFGSSFSITGFFTSPISALAIILFAIYYTYRRVGAYTKKGAYSYKYLLGLKEFMSRVKEDEIKRRLKEDPLYLEKAIPYAVLFGITEHWLKLYETLQATEPLWYHGYYYNMHNFSSGVSSAATPPASSSSGGFSGEGGFSGGGGGGGGGGSW